MKCITQLVSRRHHVTCTRACACTEHAVLRSCYPVNTVTQSYSNRPALVQWICHANDCSHTDPCAFYCVALGVHTATQHLRLHTFLVPQWRKHQLPVHYLSAFHARTEHTCPSHCNVFSRDVASEIHLSEQVALQFASSRACWKRLAALEKVLSQGLLPGDGLSVLRFENRKDYALFEQEAKLLYRPLVSRPCYVRDLRACDRLTHSQTHK